MTFEEIKQGEETYIMHTYGRFPIALDHGKGATLWDTDGKKYIDLTSGIGVNSLGHDNEALTTAVSEQAHKLMHACNLYYTEPMVQAAKKLVDAAGMGKIFFANSGAEANEGMIKLCFITTDCAVSSEMIRKALLFNVKRTFNRVTVDGDTSTNDMCTVLANGMAGNAEITAEGPAYEAFCEALQAVMQDLARKIAADGEGASKLMTCTVKGAKDEETAEVLAKSIAGSSLTKAAMFGSDANWGRVLCAMGYSGAAFNTEKVLVEFASKEGSIAVCEDGRGLDFDEDLAKKILSQDEVEINVTLQEGSGSATCWGCDLTYDYVKINGDYRT